MWSDDGWTPDVPQVVSSKVTGKLQVTIPKVFADRLGIAAGAEIVWELVGGGLRVRPAAEAGARPGRDERLLLWSSSRQRQRSREAAWGGLEPRVVDRGWTREELYDRGNAT